MVYFHLKKNEQSILLAEFNVQESTDVVIKTLINLYNGFLRLERLCDAVLDLKNHGVFKHPKDHGYSEQELKQQEIIREIVIVDGQEYIRNPDPTGQRCGLAPNDQVAQTLQETVDKARFEISKEHVSNRVCTSLSKIAEILSLLRAAVVIAYPMGLPEYDPVQEIITMSEDPKESVHAASVLEEHESSLWWAGKEIQCGKLVSDYVGQNNRTTIIVKLQSKADGAPSREPPLDEQGRKNLMAYYHRKQEEDKKLADDNDDEYLKSPWADPKHLKKSFQGLVKIKTIRQ